MRALEKGKAGRDVVRYAHYFSLTGKEEISQDDLRKILSILTGRRTAST